MTASQNPGSISVKSPGRARRWLLIILGLSLLLLAVFRPTSDQEGVGDFFPTWSWSTQNRREIDARLDELTNVTHHLPIVLAALKRGAWTVKFGDRWNRIGESLPARLQSLLPRYYDQRPAAMYWLGQHDCESEVAATVSQEWKSWSSEDRDLWLTCPHCSLDGREEYIPMLVELCQSTNSELRFAAAMTLLGHRPLTAGNAQVVAQALKTRRDVKVDEDLDYLGLLKLAILENPPTEVLGAMEGWLASTNRQRAALGALVLVRLAPARYPAQATFEPLWWQLSSAERNLVLGALHNDRYYAIVRSPWAAAFFGRLVSLDPTSERSSEPLAPKQKVSILELLRDSGPEAAEAATSIISCLSDTNAAISHAAAVAFAAVAPSVAEHVLRIRTHLTNESTAAPLLLWLTSLGTNGFSAYREVDAIARGGVHYPKQTPRQSGRLNPVLARQYGLSDEQIARAISAQNEAAVVTWRRPREITVSGFRDCPWNLVRYWPGVGKTKDLLTNRDSLETTQAQFRERSSQLPDSNLDELAWLCRSNLIKGLPTMER